MSLLISDDERKARIELLRHCVATLAKSEKEYMAAARSRYRGFRAWAASQARGPGSFVYMCERLDLDPNAIRAQMKHK